jgi:hypothetical protein
MPSSGAQTDVTVYPTNPAELKRWFRGFDEDEMFGGFAAFNATAGQEIDLVDPADVIDESLDQTRDFVVVVDLSGRILHVRRVSPSGKRVLVARRAFSPLEHWP